MNKKLEEPQYKLFFNVNILSIPQICNFNTYIKHFPNIEPVFNSSATDECPIIIKDLETGVDIPYNGEYKLENIIEWIQQTIKPK